MAVSARRVPLAGERRRCRVCACNIIWAENENGVVMPYTFAPDPGGEGNVLLFMSRLGLGVQRAVTLRGAALGELVRLGVPLNLSHFVDCPGSPLP